MNDAGRQAHLWGVDLCGLAIGIDSMNLPTDLDFFGPLPTESLAISCHAPYNSYGPYAILTGFSVASDLLLMARISVVIILARVGFLFLVSMTIYFS